ncbi:MAG: 6-pyruvoyl tetrahydropterin synthase family protein [Myxococcota bacterium]
MPSPPLYAIRLAKEDFKFSAAHFTLFADGTAERLHGHDYRVRAEVTGSHLDSAGLLVDILAVKRRIRDACSELDERTLVPSRSPALAVAAQGGDVEIRLGERLYRMPSADVVTLPILNVSVEQLARHLWSRVASALEGSLAETLRIEVEETPGLSGLFSAGLPPPADPAAGDEKPGGAATAS